ncbi:MAG: GTPase HflX, partial [Kiloniellales bacterium]
RPATLFGKGVVERFADFVKAHEIEVTIVDTALAPIQQRNLERAWHCKVIDRTGLILEIFGARARTKEGQLQVELAALSYQRSRLVRSWTHLERQRGGFGFLGGPGERQLEMDRRIITSRITRLKSELDHVRKTRALHRAARRRVPYPVVALVGYTNAGKSTLFNRLTRAEVLTGDMLFATLDPTMRRVALPSGLEVILSDTVGFISDLPHDLVAAFRATLEEVTGADLILHVRDIAHPDSEAQRQDVVAILDELGLGERLEERVIEVLNKIDLLDAESRQVLGQRVARNNGQVLASALTGEGMAELLAAIDRHLAKSARSVTLSVALDDGAAIAWLYDHGQVLARRDDARHAHLRVDLDPADLARFHHRHAEPVGDGG